MKVLELMRVHVNKIGLDATLPEAVDIMDLYQVIAIPVVDSQDIPLGVVSESDIALALKNSGGLHCATADVPAGVGELESAIALARAIRVRDIMSAPAICVDENADIQEASLLMSANGVKRLPVTSDGRVIGTISRIDICQGLLTSVDQSQV